MSKQTTATKKDKKDYFEEYRRVHRKELNDYAREYYLDNPEKYRKAFAKYSKTKKGKEAIARYEQSDKRVKAKREYMARYRARKRKENEKKKRKKK